MILCINLAYRTVSILSAERYIASVPSADSGAVCRRFLMVPSWLGNYYKFTTLVQQIFEKCPHAVTQVAARHIGTYARSLHVPQKAADLFELVAASVYSAPVTSVDTLLVPLMAQITEDAQAMDGAPPPCLLLFTSLFAFAPVTARLLAPSGCLLLRHSRRVR